MTDNNLTDKLPIEYPLNQALSIYLKRVFAFLVIVVLNFGFLGIALNSNTLSFFLWVLAITALLFLPYAIIFLLPARMPIFLGFLHGHGIIPYRSSRREIILLIPFFLLLLLVLVLIITLGYGFLSLLLRLLS
jgi:hypothetical protein